MHTVFSGIGSRAGPGMRDADRGYDTHGDGGPRNRICKFDLQKTTVARDHILRSLRAGAVSPGERTYRVSCCDFVFFFCFFRNQKQSKWKVTMVVAAAAAHDVRVTFSVGAEY